MEILEYRLKNKEIGLIWIQSQTRLSTISLGFESRCVIKVTKRMSMGRIKTNILEGNSAMTLNLFLELIFKS